MAISLRIRTVYIGKNFRAKTTQKSEEPNALAQERSSWASTAWTQCHNNWISQRASDVM